MTPAAESILFDPFANCMQLGWDAENLPFSYGVEIRSPRASRATDRLKLLCIPSSPLMSTHSPSATTQFQHSPTNWMDPPRAVQRRRALCQRLRLAVEEARRVASITKISPFLKLPNEVMENVLIHLPPQQIARSREVCRYLNEVTVHSLVLKYAMELFLAGAIDNILTKSTTNAKTTRQRLELLFAWWGAWKTLTWKYGYSAVKAFEGANVSTITGSGSIVVARNDDFRGFTVHRLPSASRGISADTWTIPGVGFEPAAFAHDYSQDLLVLVRWDDYYDFPSVCFRSLTTGEIHPAALFHEVQLASHRQVVEAGPITRRSIFRVSSVGNIVAVLLDYHLLLPSELWVVDWKSGRLLMHTYGSGRDADILPHHFDPYSFAILGDHHIILTVVTNVFSGIALFRLDADNTLDGALFSILPNADIFRLPTLMHHSKYSVITVEVNPCHPPCQPGPSGDPPFAWSNDRQLIKLTFSDSESDNTANTWTITVLIPADVLFSRMDSMKTQPSGQGYRIIGWEGWGTETRLFPLDGTFMNSTICGSRFAYLTPNLAPFDAGADTDTEADFGNLVLVIWDFASPQSLLRDFKDADKGALGQFSVEDFIIKAPHLFPEPIVTTAPFRELVSVVGLPRLPQKLLLLDDGVVISDSNNRVYVYTI